MHTGNTNNSLLGHFDIICSKIVSFVFIIFLFFFCKCIVGHREVKLCRRPKSCERTSVYLIDSLVILHEMATESLQKVEDNANKDT